MEQNGTDAMDDRRRYEESVRELSRLIRTPRLGIDYRRLYNRNPVEPSGPTLRATLLVGPENGKPRCYSRRPVRPSDIRSRTTIPLLDTSGVGVRA